MKKTNYFKKTWKYFKPYKKSLFFIALIGFVFSLRGLIEPIINANILMGITKLDFEKVIWLSCILFGYLFIFRVLRYFGDNLFAKTQGKILTDIRKDLCNKVLKLETKNFDTNSSGLFNERIKNDPASLTIVFNAIQQQLFSIISSVGVVAYIYIISVPCGLLFTVFFLLITYIQSKMFEVVKKERKKERKIAERSSTILNELIRGIREIKILNLNKAFTGYINKNLDDGFNQEVKTKKVRHKFWLIHHVSFELYNLAFIFLAVYLMMNDKLNLTNFLILYMYRSNIFTLSNTYASIKEEMAEFNISASRIFELLDGKLFPRETFGNTSLKKIKGKIEFKNVVFGYSDKKLVFNELNLLIEPNDTIAIVGKSGIGKTTLFSLLTKCYPTLSGEILIDDKNINDLSEETLKDNISMICQNPYIFNMTIQENLKLVNEKATINDIKNVCQKAFIHDYIMTLPDKYDTLLGEGGINLSGGQKQRLAIARALLKNSKIILFDEATSALDNQTQSNIQNAISAISKDYTVLIVAHRLSTIKDCNKIFVIDQGKIVGVGSHEELLNNNSDYQNIYKIELENSICNNEQ